MHIIHGLVSFFLNICHKHFPFSLKTFAPRCFWLLHNILTSGHTISTPNQFHIVDHLVYFQILLYFLLSSILRPSPAWIFFSNLRTTYSWEQHVFIFISFCFLSGTLIISFFLLWNHGFLLDHLCLVQYITFCFAIWEFLCLIMLL